MEIIISVCVSEGPVTPQGTGFLALQSVTGAKVSELFSTVTRSEQLTDFRLEHCQCHKETILFLSAINITVSSNSYLYVGTRAKNFI